MTSREFSIMRLWRVAVFLSFDSSFAEILNDEPDGVKHGHAGSDGNLEPDAATEDGHGSVGEGSMAVQGEPTAE